MKVINEKDITKLLNELDNDMPSIYLCEESAIVIRDLTNRIKELETAIRNHRDQKGDDRCWLDDLELYKIIGDISEVDQSLPPK